MFTEELSLDNAISRQEAAEAIRRRGGLIAAFLFVGLLLGILAEFLQQPKASISLLINVNKGPRVLSQSLYDETDWMERSAPVYVPLEPAVEAELGLKELIPADSEGWQVSPLKLSGGRGANFAQLTASGSLSQVNRLQQQLQTIAAEYRRRKLQYANTFVKFQAPSDGWTTLLEPELQVSRRGARIFQGALIGLFSGSLLAWLLDRFSGRIFRADQLQLLLGYSLLAVLPLTGWDNLWSKAQITQLSLVIDPGLAWRVVSIAKPHFAVGQLALALQEKLPHVDLKAEQPLLLNALMPAVSGSLVGVLIVVERGFNSAKALLDVRRVLGQLPFVATVGLVLIGESHAPEIRGD